MGKAIVILEIGPSGLAQVFSPDTAIALSEALYDAAEQAQKEGKSVSVTPVPNKGDPAVTEKLPEDPPEPKGVAPRFSPAVEEAMDFGEHSAVGDAPKAIIDLANILYNADLSDDDHARSIRKVVGLLQSVVYEVKGA
jgi:hypothetical protein